MARVEDLITGHNGYKVFGVREIDNIMRPAGDHVDGFYFVSGHFKFYQLSCIDISFLDQAMAMNHDKLLPFGMMPMFSLGNSWFGDIDADLTAI